MEFPYTPHLDGTSIPHSAIHIVWTSCLNILWTEVENLTCSRIFELLPTKLYGPFVYEICGIIPSIGMIEVALSITHDSNYD